MIPRFVPTGPITMPMAALTLGGAEELRIQLFGVGDQWRVEPCRWVLGNTEDGHRWQPDIPHLAILVKPIPSLVEVLKAAARHTDVTISPKDYP